MFCSQNLLDYNYSLKLSLHHTPPTKFHDHSAPVKVQMPYKINNIKK